jgi:F-type H+-transporting ATPase subunit epsilon
MMLFNLEIITQEKTLLKAEVVSLYVTTLDGDITVLARHTPYVGILKPGEIVIKKDDKEELFACTGGILEINREKVVILADSAVRSDEIDEEEATRVKEQAEKLMAGKLESRENAEIIASLERALLHINIARKRRHHK